MTVDELQAQVVKWKNRALVWKRAALHQQTMCGGIDAEVKELRKAQIASTMPIIGELLDAWDGLPNDLKSDPGMDHFSRVMGRLDDAMEGCEG